MMGDKIASITDQSYRLYFIGGFNMYFVNKELCIIKIDDGTHLKSGREIKTLSIYQNLKNEFLICSGFTYNKEVNLRDFTAFKKDNGRIAIGCKKNDYETFIVCTPYRGTLETISVYDGECVYAQSTHLESRQDFNDGQYHNFLFMIVNSPNTSCPTIKIRTVRQDNGNIFCSCDTISITEHQDCCHTPEYRTFESATISVDTLNKLKRKKVMKKIHNVVPVEV